MRLNGIVTLFRAKELLSADGDAELPEWRIRAVTLRLRLHWSQNRHISLDRLQIRK